LIKVNGIKKKRKEIQRKENRESKRKRDKCKEQSELGQGK
jgi:hypothetical protein